MYPASVFLELFVGFGPEQRCAIGVVNRRETVRQRCCGLTASHEGADD